MDNKSPRNPDENIKLKTESSSDHSNYRERTEKPYIERFNRTYREEVLNTYLFDTLDRVREITENRMRSYMNGGHTARLEGCQRVFIGKCLL